MPTPLSREGRELIQAQTERAQAQRNATPPPPASTDLPMKPDSTTTFQIQPSRKEDTSVKDRVKIPNVSKVAKTTTKRKNTEVEI
ncbi:hypothetical protein DPV78_010070 [Talaromyces pinophilus]|nr:hypothetical protein DPV78_010070 [Talaromyces pinophilus]